MGKKPRKKSRPQPRFDPEVLFSVYLKHQGNLHALLRKEPRSGIPRVRTTWQRYEKVYRWVERRAKIEAEATRKADDIAAATAAKRQAKLLENFDLAIEQELRRLLDPEGQFIPDTKGSLLRALGGSLKDAQFLRGGPSERADHGFGLSIEDLEEAARHPDGLRAGIDAVRRRRFGNRIPERLPDE